MSGWTKDVPVEITDWSIGTDDPDNGFLAPECRKYRLHGLRVHDGKYIRTSHIVKPDKGDGIVVTSSGTFYKLGKINPEYEKWLKEWRAGR
jgi:hypothetical protein